MTQLTGRADLLHRFVFVQLIEAGQRWIVGSGDSRAGQRGQAIAIIGLRHASAYEVVLQLDSGKIDSFSAMQLMPEASNDQRERRESPVSTSHDLTGGSQNG